jgi:hypothetical protein
MSSRRGLSLLEVLISLGLITMVVFSIIVVYTGLLSGTSRADVNREAVAAMDYLCQAFEMETRRNWPGPDDPPPDPPSLTAWEKHNLVMYQVEDLGRVPNPLEPDKFLELKTIIVRVRFDEQGADGQPVQRTYQTRLLVAR